MVSLEFFNIFLHVFVTHKRKECAIFTYHLGQVQVFFENVILHRISDNSRHGIKSELPYI